MATANSGHNSQPPRCFYVFYTLNNVGANVKMQKEITDKFGYTIWVLCCQVCGDGQAWDITLLKVGQQ